MRISLFGLWCLVALGMSLSPAQAPAQRADELDPAIQRAAFQFLDAALPLEVDAVVEQVGTPFFLAVIPPAVVLKDKQELQRHLEQLRRRVQADLQRQGKLGPVQLLRVGRGWGRCQEEIWETSVGKWEAEG